MASMDVEESKPIPYVKEVVLKKCKKNEEWAIRRREQMEQLSKDNKKLVFKRAKDFIKEYRRKELDLVNMKHMRKLGKTTYFTPESNVHFIIRLCGKNYMHPKAKKILMLKKILERERNHHFREGGESERGDVEGERQT
ncbi:hypothetical protein GIB67_029552 [Kingdonia uniflora]|uniref:Large ribosomal subunit protein uL30 N-terminal eukaryotes domain-containing protein n=1 Tax=Kingdonia uniflora TaxID=39325 RepID=A0A7J7NYX3_9MAGN|nr:hypothetical protein GIB67_029552 [Kingdonia uniflora]